MPSKNPDYSRRQALAGAIEAVAKAARNGGMISIDLRAQRLLNEHADCGLSLAELREELARLAKEQGVSVSSASHNRLLVSNPPTPALN